MNAVAVLPGAVGRKGEDAENVPDHTIRPTTRKKGAVGTVVKEHKETDHKGRGGNGEENGYPGGVARLDGEIHQDDESRVGYQGIC